MITRILTVGDVARTIIDEANAAIKANFRSSVASLYAHDSQGKPVHAGTCSFIKSDSGHFLVSARHVFENVGYTGVHILTAIGLAPLPLDGYQTTPPNSEKSDLLDLFIAKLDDRHASWMGSVTFVDIEAACRLIQNQNGGFQMTGLLGYPHSRNKPNLYMSTVQAQPYLVSGPTRSRSQIPKKSKFRDDLHVFMKYEAKKSVDRDGRQKKAVKPQGMSGGLMVDLGIRGLIQELKDGPLRNPIPIGIITDWMTEPQIVVGAKFSALKNAIELYQDQQNIASVRYTISS